jgi:predicted negative regulator of RcsB-dependent stress response
VEIYETEEEQVAALKAWWKENAQTTLIGLGLGIAVMVGWNYWQDYREAQAEQASDLYGQLLKSLAADKKDSTVKLSGQLDTQFPNSDYALFGELLAAKVKADQGDIAGAKQILEKVSVSSNKELSNIAKIRRVRLLMANKEFEQGLKLINEIDPAASASFAGQYDELTGDLYVALDRADQARTAYQSALRNGHQSALLQLKIDDLTAPEKVENNK